MSVNKIVIDERDGGYTRFKQESENKTYREAWKTLELKVRRVVQDDRNETQVEVTIEQTLRTKTPGKLLTRSQSFSLGLNPADAKALALAICPELGKPVAAFLEGGVLQTILRPNPAKPDGFDEIKHDIIDYDIFDGAPVEDIKNMWDNLSPETREYMLKHCPDESKMFTEAA